MKYLEKLIKNNAVVQKLYIVFGSLFFRFIALFIPVKKNMVLFSAMSGNNYEYSSPYYIYQELLQRLGDTYDYVWAFSKRQKAPSYNGKRVRMNSFAYFIAVLRSGIWVTDVNVERGLRLKRKKQYYVNTWHGGITKGLPKKRKDYCLTNVDIFCSDGSNYDDYFIKYYKVNPSALIHSGRPREDSIFENQAKREENRARLGLQSGDYVILYMPTWRETKVDYYLNVQKVADAIPNSVVLFHAHNLDDERIVPSEEVRDCSNVADLNMLYGVADLLISDYSSCMYDFLLLRKPVLIFGKDYDDYEADRGFAVNYKELFPFSILKTEEEVIEKINVLRINPHQELYDAFMKNVVDVTRDKKAVDLVIEKMEQDGVI